MPMCAIRARWYAVPFARYVVLRHKAPRLTPCKHLTSGRSRPAGLAFSFALVVAMSDKITLGNIGSLDSPITDLIARACGAIDRRR